MVVTVHSSALIGVEALPVSVEVKTRDSDDPKDTRFEIIGLGDNAVKEAKSRVWSALASQGFRVPAKILINLAPAELRKEGAAFDLPMAIGILASSGQLATPPQQAIQLFGELSLSGILKPVRGISASVAGAREQGARLVLIPFQNLEEALLIEGIEVHGFRTLGEVVNFLREGVLPKLPNLEPAPRKAAECRYLSEVSGQQTAKRALIIAAAGGHNVLMIGPPGCGKSMLAERFSDLLPPLTPDEKLECLKAHSIAGHPIDSILQGRRPLRNPHYIISDPGLVGGGNPPRPGEITLAHRGVLFLDEFPEFKRSALEALRIPLEAGRVTIARARHSVTLPAQFQLLAAMNPCPCGKLGDGADGKLGCGCPRSSVSWYLRKLSQPILDRIDLHVEMTAFPIKTVAGTAPVKNSEEQSRICETIRQSHRLQRERNRGLLNAHMPQERLKCAAALSDEALSLLEKAAHRLALSARGYMRIIRVARTIADLEECGEIGTQHISEAVSYRGLDRLKRYAESSV